MAEPWPFAPLSPVVERLEWLTEVLPARQAEQRLALRATPRETLVLRHRLDQAGQAEAMAAIRAGFSGEWDVPAWPRGADAASVPTRAGYLAQPVALSRERRSRAILQATFTLRPDPETPASPFAAYLGADVVTDPTILRGPAEDRAEIRVAYVDGAIGPVAVEPAREWVEQRQTLTLREFGPPPRLARRAWLKRLRGRLTAFWLPSWAGELRLTAPVGAGATQIRVAAFGNPAAHVGRDLMLDAAIPAFARVTGASVDGAEHLIDVTPALPAAPIETLVHWLVLSRLDSDSVEIVHTETASEFSVTAVEVPA